MLHGTFVVPRVAEESVCRSAEDDMFNDITRKYKIHATALMPNIPFAEAAIQQCNIDASILINDDETNLTFESNIKCQNFLSTIFIGRAPLEWYDAGENTKMGRQFVLICRNGNPSDAYRVFGTENAIRGYNRNANENIQLPNGGGS